MHKAKYDPCEYKSHTLRKKSKRNKYLNKIIIDSCSSLHVVIYSRHYDGFFWSIHHRIRRLLTFIGHQYEQRIV